MRCILIILLLNLSSCWMLRAYKVRKLRTKLLLNQSFLNLKIYTLRNAPYSLLLSIYDGDALVYFRIQMKSFPKPRGYISFKIRWLFKRENVIVSGYGVRDCIVLSFSKHNHSGWSEDFRLQSLNHTSIMDKKVKRMPLCVIDLNVNDLQEDPGF